MFDQLPSDVDPSVVRKLKSDPRVYVTNAWNDPIETGARYDFTAPDGTELTYLLDDDGPLNPDEWADVNLLLMARGCLKSTVTRMIFNWLHDAYPAFDSYFIAPTQDEVTNWTSNFSKNIEESGLQPRLNEGVNKKTYKKFKTYREGADGRDTPVIGEFQTDSGFTPESVQGPHSQGGLIDEFQDLNKSVFDRYLPAVDKVHPDVDWFPVIFGIGTPRETGTFFHELWERAEQRTWDADTDEWITQSEAKPYTLGSSQARELGIDPDELDAKKIRAWHIDWVNSPLHDDSQIAQAKNTLSEMRFENEILANFYDPEDNLLTASDVQALFDAERAFSEQRVADNATLAIGVDWGGGGDKNAADTVMVAAEQMTFGEDTETVIRNVNFVDDALSKAEQVREVENWILQYDPDHVVVDYGFGAQAMESLQDGEDTRSPDGYDSVVACRYGNVQNKADVTWETTSGQQRFFTCDKTRNTSRMVDWLRSGAVTIPSADLSTEPDGPREKLINHLTAAYKTLAETPQGKKKVRIETPAQRNDDALDAFTFCWLALHELSATDYYVGFSASNDRTPA